VRILAIASAVTIGLSTLAPGDVYRSPASDGFEFASRSLATFLDYRVITRRHDLDQLIREYLKLMCGRDSGAVGKQYNDRIDSTPVEMLFPLESWSGALQPSCGCLYTVHEESLDVCGDAWLDKEIWRVRNPSAIHKAGLVVIIALTKDEPDRSVPVGGSLVSATLLETLRYRDQRKTTSFDGVIREATRIVCKFEGVQTNLVRSTPIDELFPISLLATANAAGCGYLVTDDGRRNGIAFDSAAARK